MLINAYGIRNYSFIKGALHVVHASQHNLFFIFLFLWFSVSAAILHSDSTVLAGILLVFSRFFISSQKCFIFWELWEWCNKPGSKYCVFCSRSISLLLHTPFTCVVTSLCPKIWCVYVHVRKVFAAMLLAIAYLTTVFVATVHFTRYICSLT